MDNANGRNGSDPGSSGPGEAHITVIDPTVNDSTVLERAHERLLRYAQQTWPQLRDSLGVVDQTMEEIAYPSLGQARNGRLLSSRLHQRLVQNVQRQLKREALEAAQFLQFREELFYSRQDDPFETVAKDEFRRALRNAVETLGTNERLAFLLHELEGLTHAEIATILGVSGEGARLMYRRAVKQLGLALDDYR